MKIEENNEAGFLRSVNKSEPMKNIDMNSNLKEAEEKKCRRLFKKMSIAKYKSSKECYFLWNVLQYHFIGKSLGYDTFKIAYTAFMAAECEKIRAWNSNISTERLYEKCVEKNEEKEGRVLEAPTIHSLLSIWITVNGFRTIAYIDSGSSFTNISLSFAKKAGLMKNMDIRSRPIVVGLHPVRMVGTVHSCCFEISGVEYETKAHIWNELPEIDVLIGLDFLRLHNCIINVSENRFEHNWNACTYTEFNSDAEEMQWKNEYTGHKRRSTEVHEKKLLHVVGMGFEKELAERALKVTLNDVPCAVKYLFTESQKKVKLTGKIDNYITPYVPTTKDSTKSEHSSAINIHQVTHKSTKNSSKNAIDQMLMNLAEADEIQCKQLFESLNKPLIKLEIYRNWPRLHQQLVKFPNDQEKFRQECAIVSSLNKKKIDLMNDRSSAMGKALVIREKREKKFDNHRKEREEKMLRNFKPLNMFYIRIRINGISMLAYVDTGAATSVLPLKVVKKTGLQNTIKKTSILSRVECVGGDTKTIGKVSCSFDISNTRFEANCIVLERIGKEGYVIIGLDFMHRHKCILDCATNILTFNGKIRVGAVPDSKIEKYLYGNKYAVNPSFEVDASKLAKLVEMEFDEEKAAEALTNTLNNLPAAVCTLYYEEAQKT